MKRLTALLLIAVLAMSLLSACSGDKTESTVPTEMIVASDGELEPIEQLPASSGDLDIDYSTLPASDGTLVVEESLPASDGDLAE